MFTLKNGRKLVIFRLPLGDGLYPSDTGFTYAVDSGTIGATLVEGLESEFGETTEDWSSMLKRVGQICDTQGLFCISNIIDPVVARVTCVFFNDETINSEDELSGLGAWPALPRLWDWGKAQPNPPRRSIRLMNSNRHAA
jgi:hypothetical protein